MADRGLSVQAPSDSEHPDDEQRYAGAEDELLRQRRPLPFRKSDRQRRDLKQTPDHSHTRHPAREAAVEVGGHATEQGHGEEEHDHPRRQRCGVQSKQQVGAYGLAPLVSGMGLFIATPSYNGEITFNVISTRDIMPDVEFFVECLQESLDALKKAAAPKKKATKKRSTSKKAKTKKKLRAV